MPKLQQQQLAENVQGLIEKLHNSFLHSKQQQQQQQPNDADIQYERHLNKSLLQKQQFLNIAEKQLELQPKKLTLEEETKGLSITNNRIPFKVEREDVIDVSLAHSTLDSDLNQLDAFLARQERMEIDIKNQIKYQKELKAQLEYIHEQLSRDLETEPEQSLTENLRIQQIRHDTLRQHLEYLITTYNIDLKELT